jgi:putative flavoprotein involved in K+ transport
MRTEAVIIGAGHAGLAMSSRLTDRSIDHVILERGEVAHSWRTERWPTMRLLTPNWQTRLPGAAYNGTDPDGYQRAAEVADLLAGYAARIRAPVQTVSRVTALRIRGPGYQVVTDHGAWHAPAVVIATGACSRPALPDAAVAVPPSVSSLTPLTYSSPAHLPDGGVLVVGGSATGVQLADEIHRSGRPVTIAVGEQVRLPRVYRGRDIFWWLESAGVLGQRYDEIADIVRARHLPSPQLIGTPERRSLDLNALRAIGVRIVGRLGRITDGVAQFSGGLANLCALADLKMNRALDAFDAWARDSGTDGDMPHPHRFEPIRVEAQPVLTLDLARSRIRTIVWATGYRPDYHWLDIPVTGRNGHIRHNGGVVTNAPGLYLLGMPLLRRRASTYIHGAGPDTDELSDHLRDYLAGDQNPGARPIAPVQLNPG